MKHFTASAYLFEGEKVLLIHHRKAKKWFGAGGHLNENEMPHEAVIREVKEETGLDIEIIHDERVWIEPQLNGRSLPRPALILLEKIPPHKDDPEHYHIDYIYAARPIGGELLEDKNELLGMGWFTMEETKELEMYQETRDVLGQLFPLHQVSVRTRNYSSEM